METTDTFHNKKMMVAENVGFKFEAGLFKSIPMILGFYVMDNVETFRHKKMVAAETVSDSKLNSSNQ